MLFNSYQFLLFFPIVILLYFSTAQRFRWLLLLAASYFFYMCWEPGYLILILVSTLIDYVAGLKMGAQAVKAKRRKYLILSLTTNLGLLGAFKYFNFFNDSFCALFQSLNIPYHVPSLNVLLPVGISFYTFQTLSYSIDVYRGDRPPEKHLGLFALYVAFFPQLVAGPIERSTHLLPQFLQKFDFDEKRVVSGLRLMLWGMFKKVVIADRLAVFVDGVYGHLTVFSGLEMMVATLFFAVQIYCDFSGYSDIAIGSARVLGFKLMDNFKSPYFAKSIPEFWQRWHISLSTWFRDYLYIPLGGSRVPEWRVYLNVGIVFLLSGLWHGANWTFVVWGALHASYFMLSRLTRPYREKAVQRLGLGRWPRCYGVLRQAVTFSLVCFAWIFFRADSLNDAFYIVTHLFSGLSEQAFFDADLRTGLFGRGVDMLMTGMLILLLGLVDLFQHNTRYRWLLFERSRIVSWGVYLGLCLYIMDYGIVNNIPFIYFQF